MQERKGTGHPNSHHHAAPRCQTRWERAAAALLISNTPHLTAHKLCPRTASIQL